MKSILPKIKKLLKDTKGASLMEFAVVTGLMAVLASTAAPKFSTISESGRHRKSITEMEKIGTQALNFFQDMAVKEGRGRFPGQTKYNQKVGGHTSMEDIERDILGLEAENMRMVILQHLPKIPRFSDLMVLMVHTGFLFLGMIVNIHSLRAQP